MRFMLAGAVAAATALGFATGARAEARLYDGSIVITSATPKCNAIGDIKGSLRGIFRPRILGSDPKSAIILQTDDLSHIVLLRATTNVNTMNGTGSYLGIDFDPTIGESTQWSGGKYDFSIAPAVATVATTEIRVTGQVTKFGNIAGCVLSFRGAFLKRPEQQ